MTYFRRGQYRWLLTRVLVVLALVSVVIYCHLGDQAVPHRTDHVPGHLASEAQTLLLPPPLPPGAAEVEMVVAATRGDNVTWLHDELPDWPKRIYTVDDPRAEHAVPKNKGHEAMVFLTYIIDRYDSLPAHVVFHHARRFQWHNDDPDYDALPPLRALRLPHLRRHGYLNLRCCGAIGCPVEIRPHEDQSDTLPDDADGAVHARYVYKAAFAALFPDSDVPAAVGAPCCGQFAVTREAVRARPREDFVRFREWLMDTELADALSGRVFEYLWHNAVHCPNTEECYCKQYGKCGILGCTEQHCPGQYEVPIARALPAGWPRYGWKGEDRHWRGEL